MDRMKIGKFIAECRKNVNLTQMQLAEKLGITDKAVSKWERGIAMPDASVMLELCGIFRISVNELLSGEKLYMENNSLNNEQLLLDMAKELQQKNKAIKASMWTILAVSITALFAGLLLAAFLMPEGPLQLAAVLGICTVFLIPCFYALKLEADTGFYRCRSCGHEFVPTYVQVLNAMHIGTTRHLKCPGCGKRSWSKKVWHK